MAPSIISTYGLDTPRQIATDGTELYVMCQENLRRLTFVGSTFIPGQLQNLGGAGRGVFVDGAVVHTGVYTSGIGARSASDITTLLDSDAFNYGEGVWSDGSEVHIAADVLGLRRYSWSGSAYTYLYGFNPTEFGGRVDKIGNIIALGTFGGSRVYLLRDTGSAYAQLDVGATFSADEGVRVWMQDASTLWAGDRTELRLYDISADTLNLLDTYSGPGISPMLHTDGFRILASGDDTIALYRRSGSEIVQDATFTDAVTFSNLAEMVLLDGIVFILDRNEFIVAAFDPDFPAIDLQPPIGPTPPYLRMYQHLLPRAKAWKI